MPKKPLSSGSSSSASSSNSDESALTTENDPRKYQAEFAELLLKKMASRIHMNVCVCERDSITVNGGTSTLEVIDKLFNLDGSKKEKEIAASPWPIVIQQRVNGIRDYGFCKNLSDREIILLDAVISSAHNELLEKYGALSARQAESSDLETQLELQRSNAKVVMQKKKDIADAHPDTKSAKREYEESQKKYSDILEMLDATRNEIGKINAEIAGLRQTPRELFNRLPAGPFLLKKNKYDLDPAFNTQLKNVASFSEFEQLKRQFVDSLNISWGKYFTGEEDPRGIQEGDPKNLAMSRIRNLFNRCEGQIAEGGLSCQEAFEKYIMQGQGGLMELKEIADKTQADKRSPFKSKVATAVENFYSLLSEAPYQFKPVQVQAAVATISKSDKAAQPAKK